MSKKIKIKFPLRVLGIFVLSLLLLGLVAPVIAPTLLKIDSYIQIPHAQASPDGMEQVLFGGDGGLDPTNTEYASLIGRYGFYGTESAVYKIVSTDGVIKWLRIVIIDHPPDYGPGPGVGQKYTFTLMVNSNPTDLTVEIAGTSTSGNDMIHEIDVTGGDTISLRCVPDCEPLGHVEDAYYTVVFESDTVCESLILGGSQNTLNNGATEYGQVMTATTWYSTTENNFREVVPTNGTIENFYLKLTSDPGTSPDAYRFTLRKNKVSTDLTVTITADDTTGNDLINTVDVVAGDILTLIVEPLNTPSAEPYAAWGMTFVADINGESIVMGGSLYDLPNSYTTYNNPISRDIQMAQGWASDEPSRFSLGQVCTVKKLHMLLSGSPGGGNKYDFTIRADLADTNVVATVSGAATTGNSGALEDTVALDDFVSLECDPDSYPTARDAYWGFVCYIAPPVTVTQTFLSTTTTDETVCIYTVVQVIIDPITTVTVTSSSYTTTGTTVVTSTATCTTTCETSVSTTSTTTCETSTSTSLTTTCTSSTVTLLTFCETSTIPTSCTTISSTSCETLSSTLTSTTITCTTTTWTETTTYATTLDG